MTAQLIEKISDVYISPSSKEKFFSKEERFLLSQDFDKKEKPNNPLSPCDTNLFIGVFFDGTRNNYRNSIKNKDYSQSNVARLYSAFPGLSVPGVLPASTDWQTNLDDYKNYFRIYAPGVGSAFPQIEDSGEGVDGTGGASAGYLGQARILWGMAQVINAISRFFTKQIVIDNNMVLEASNFGSMNVIALHSNPLKNSSARMAARHGGAPLPRKLVEWLKILHRAIDPHMIKTGKNRPTNIDPGIVRHIYLSTFGFSRGSAQARVFINWLIKLCKLDAELTQQKANGMTLAGFPLSIDFLGIFDTVASVGVANIAPFADGHAAWADAEVSLAIPSEVAKCVHLVAAHEQRRCFPMDSIYNDHSMPENGEEIVFPGVHSDLGGGYCPQEQGKGIDNIGRDMVSRIPLAVMYRKARLSGVPLKLEQALPQDKVGFDIFPKTIADFNAYIEQCSTKSGETGKIVREHWRYGIEWRVDNHRHGGVTQLSSYQRASNFDQNVLRSGDKHFGDELDEFTKFHAKAHLDFGNYKYWEPTNPWQQAMDILALADWIRIDSFWDKLGQPSEAVSVMMNEYVHDSVAGFLFTGPDSRSKAIDELTALIDKKHLIESIEESAEDHIWDKMALRHEGARLTRKERGYIDYYEKTGKVPPDFPVGLQESSKIGAGYLRFRRIYAGADDQVLADLLRLPANGAGAEYAQQGSRPDNNAVG